MKKLYSVIVLLFFGLAAKGQQLEIGAVAGTSLDGFCLIDAGVDAACNVNVFRQLTLGAGAGMRFSMPAEEHVDFFITSDSHGAGLTKSYISTVLMPVFGRIRYSLAPECYVQTDIGYRFGFYKKSSEVYFEPQLGAILFGRHSIAVGLIIQNKSTPNTVVVDRYYSFESFTQAWRTAVFIKYGFFL